MRACLSQTSGKQFHRCVLTHVERAENNMIASIADVHLMWTRSLWVVAAVEEVGAGLAHSRRDFSTICVGLCIKTSAIGVCCPL